MAKHRSTRRRVLSAIGATALAALGQVVARAEVRSARVGVLIDIDRDKSVFFPPFVKRLAELGYVEGRNLGIDYRSSSGIAERFPILARELIALSPDLIIAVGSEQSARALLTAKVTIPVVCIAVNYDPVEKGIVASYHRPGGNVTGVYIPAPALAAKRVELVRDFLPQVRRVLVLSDAFTQSQLAPVRKAAAALGIEVEAVAFTEPPYKLEAAFERGRAAHSQALVVLASPELQNSTAKIVELCLEHRLPAIGFLAFQAEAGLLASYGAEAGPISARAAAIATRILQGAKPADVPMEQANEYEFVVNGKTAKALGIKISQSILQRADKVIE